MTIRQVAEALGAEIAQGEFEDADITGAYTSDLLSDVMAHAHDGEALITIQAHKNTVAVASLVNIPVIVVCNSRPLSEDMLKAAKDEGIAVIRTRENQFAASGKLYRALNGESA